MESTNEKSRCAEINTDGSFKERRSHGKLGFAMGTMKAKFWWWNLKLYSIQSTKLAKLVFQIYHSVGYHVVEIRTNNH
jgi:hypothetical protein